MPDLQEIEELIELMRRSGVSEISLELPDYKIKIKRAPEAEDAQPAGLPAGRLEGLPAGSPAGLVAGRQPGAPAASPQTAAANNSAFPADPNVTIVAEVVSVVSPVVGVFHNAGMDEPRTRISAGDRVDEGQLLAVIEAMKVPNEVHAPAGGFVAQVLVEDGAAVGYGDRLFLIQPLQENANGAETPIGLA